MAQRGRALRDLGLLFLTGYFQVFLVAVNTWQIANRKWLGAFLVAYLISFFWAINVRRVSFGGWFERLIYPLGAALGCISGMLLSKMIYGG